MGRFKIHCQEPWFSLIKSGQKMVEGRKNSPYYQQIKAGDTIEFFVEEGSFLCLVTKVNSYADLQEYLTHETLSRALPGVSTMEQGLAIYHAWNSDKEIRKWGFLGIQISVLEGAL